MTAWTKYGAHALAYIASALAIVQAYAPAAVPGKGIAIAAAAAAALALIHQIQTAAAPKTLPPPVVKALIPLLAVLAFCGGLAGCATVSGWFAAPSSQPYIVAAIDVAVATAEQKGVPAAQINAIAKQALAADQGTTATLATVAALVNAQIARAHLPPGDLAAANILEVAAEAAIQAKIGNDPKVASAQAAVAQVLNAVIAATGG